MWNPDIERSKDLFEDWQEVPETKVFDNAFKTQWELFLKHVVLDNTFPWNMKEGAKGVQLADLALKSWATRKWLDVPPL